MLELFLLLVLLGPALTIGLLLLWSRRATRWNKQRNELEGTGSDTREHSSRKS
jgi:hypothetical protein